MSVARIGAYTQAEWANVKADAATAAKIWASGQTLTQFKENYKARTGQAYQTKSGLSLGSAHATVQAMTKGAEFTTIKTKSGLFKMTNMYGRQFQNVRLRSPYSKPSSGRKYTISPDRGKKATQYDKYAKKFSKSSKYPRQEKTARKSYGNSRRQGNNSPRKSNSNSGTVRKYGKKTGIRGSGGLPKNNPNSRLYQRNKKQNSPYNQYKKKYGKKRR